MHSSDAFTPLAQSSEATVSSRPSLSYWQDALVTTATKQACNFFAVFDYRPAAVYLCRAVCLDSRPIRSRRRPNQHRTRCRPLGDLGRRLSTLVWGTKQWLCAQRQRSRLNLCSCHLHPSGTFGLAKTRVQQHPGAIAFTATCSPYHREVPWAYLWRKPKICTLKTGSIYGPSITTTPWWRWTRAALTLTWWQH